MQGAARDRLFAGLYSAGAMMAVLFLFAPEESVYARWWGVGVSNVIFLFALIVCVVQAMRYWFVIVRRLSGVA